MTSLIYAFGFCMTMNGQCTMMSVQDASWGSNPQAYCERMVSGKNTDPRVRYGCFTMKVPTWSMTNN